MHNLPANPVFVETPDALARACKELARATVLCVDTEFHRENTYFPQFALIQVASGHACYLIDPLAVGDLSLLWELLHQPQILKVFHAARQDLEIILNESGKLPAPIFDTQIAAALLGFGQQVGFGNLVQRILKTSLPKLESFSDWLARPLRAEQIAYAADDVIYLLPIYHQLKEKLVNRGRHDWLEEEQSVLADASTYSINPAEIFWRVKGVNKLRGQQLAVLRELAAWRETEAQTRNTPRRRIVADEPMLEIARRSHLSLGDMERLRGLHASTVRKFGPAILNAWEKGHQCPSEDWPRSQPRINHSPGSELRLELLTTLVRLRAEHEQIAANILASKRELAQLASWGRSLSGNLPDVACLQGWRKRLVGDDLLSLLKGEICLHLDTDTKMPVIERIT